MPFTFLQLHEIAEAGHRVLNPFTEEKLLTVGRAAHLGPDQRILDLACGTAEMLCRFAIEFGTTGHGVDISPVFVGRARERIAELGVAVTVSEGDASTPEPPADPYDVVACIGATWIGGGLAGTLDLMRPLVRPGGLLLVGEPYWAVDPPSDLGFDATEFTDLAGVGDRFVSAEVELVEMVLADGDSWDRYAAAQWWSLDQWLRENPEHADREQVREFLASSRRDHLRWQRRCLGWGVFVGRVA